jgi:hypothetical protein
VFSLSVRAGRRIEGNVIALKGETMKTILMMSVVLGLCFSAKVAAASNYICNAFYYPGTGVLGNFGSVHITVYTGPSCSGSFVGGYYFCSAGATTTTFCATSIPNALAPNSQAMAEISAGAREAAIFQAPVDVQLMTCGSGTFSCGEYIIFY